jgi:ferritin-like protein
MTIRPIEIFKEVVAECVERDIKELCELTGGKPEDYQELSPLDLRDALREERLKHEG